MSKQVALVVDDEPDIRELLQLTLSKMDIDVIDVANVTDAKRVLGEKSFNLCLTDMRLPDGDGIELVEYIQQRYSSIPVAVITAYGNMELAITALKAGAFDFVSKPVNLKILRDLVSKALLLRGEEETEESGLDTFGLLGKTACVLELANKIYKLSRSQAPIYISGGSGSGKELVAGLIHQLGPRNKEPFIPVNCGAIPEHLMESEFFGHKKGSFTGAVENKKGLFQAANGGTLFLDEVADLPMAMQVKLLRAIQEKAVRPIGTQQEVTVDVRILSATHKNLHELVKQGQFRQDLFYRINVIELNVPSLAERREDIPLLANHILENLSQKSQQDKPVIADDAIVALQQYTFPGNVRELENILERAMTLCENNIISVEDLQLDNIVEIVPKKYPTQAEVESLAGPELANTSKEQVDPELPLETYLDEIERRRIEEVLEKTHWNKAKTAEILGITLRALRYRLKKLGLE